MEGQTKKPKKTLGGLQEEFQDIVHDKLVDFYHLYVVNQHDSLETINKFLDAHQKFLKADSLEEGEKALEEIKKV